jgi:protein ImuA
MNDAPSLQQLLARTDLWRGSPAAPPATDARGTGFARLDRALHAGGWPMAGLVELLCASPCPQALRLMLPAMADVDDGLTMLVNPPARPHSRTLSRAGLDLSRLLVLHGKQPRILLRACHEALTSQAVSVLVAWLPPEQTDPKTLHRLHLAAREGRCLLVLMREREQLAQPSPAPLRLLLTPTLPGDLQIEIHKQPGGWAGQRLRVPILPEHLRLPPAPPAFSRAPATTPVEPIGSRTAPVPLPEHPDLRERPG